MNTSKWEKLLEVLIKEFGSIFIRYKKIGQEQVKETELDTIDFRPFFIEPTLYKEVEWIEFPREILLIKNQRTSRQTISKHNQDTKKIESLITTIGIFNIEGKKEGLRLYGYKK